MKRKKKVGFFRIIPLLLLCAVILGVVTLAIMPDTSSGIKAFLRNIRGGKGGEFYYENTSGGVFAQVGNDLCLLSDTGLTVFDSYGEARFTHSVSYSVPVLHSAGRYGVAYDLGGTELTLFSSGSVIAELKTEAPIVSARAGEKGFFAVCTEESGWGGSATVYDRKGFAIYKWYAGTDKVLSACVRGKNDLLVLSLGSEGSNLVRLSLDSEDELARYTYDGLIYDASFAGNGISAFTPSSVLFFSDRLEESGSCDLSEMHLSYYDLNGVHPVLLTGDSAFSPAHTVSVLDGDGTELHKLQSDVPITDISARGNCVAVLYSDGRAVVYDKDMNVYASYEDVSGFDRIMLRSNGSVIAAGLYSARILSGKAVQE